MATGLRCWTRFRAAGGLGIQGLCWCMGWVGVLVLRMLCGWRIAWCGWAFGWFE